jgi:hypothetical protein
VPASVYAFIIGTALVIATISLGLFHLLVWLKGWVRWLWVERETVREIYQHYYGKGNRKQ